MRICFLGLEIIPSKGVFVGGLVNNVIRLAKGLANKGHEITIITSNVRRSIDLMPSSSLYKLSAVSCHGRYASTLHGTEFLVRGSFRVVKELMKKRFDIVHIHSAYPILGLLSNVSLVGHIPSVFTLYSPLRSEPLKDRGGFYQSLSVPALSKLYLRRIDAIISVSDNVRRSLNLVGFNRNDVELIPPAVDDNFFNGGSFTSEAKEKLGFSEGIPLILYCGNWAPWKGVDVLIESMTTIVNKYPQAKLITAWNEVYDWYDERKMEIARKIKKLGLENNIVEMGVVENIWELMAACDVLVVPFLNTDGVADYPLVILEAMACGKPVVSTKVGGIPEIIQNGVNGFWVRPKDEKGLGDVICSLLDNKELAERISANARRYASENFSVNSVVKKYEKVYRNAITKNKTSLPTIFLGRYNTLRSKVKKD